MPGEMHTSPSACDANTLSLDNTHDTDLPCAAHTGKVQDVELLRHAANRAGHNWQTAVVRFETYASLTGHRQRAT